MSKIGSGEELVALLTRAMEIEAGFESVAQWEAYLEVSRDDIRDLLFQLITESEGHKTLVQEIISKVKVGTDFHSVPLSPRPIKFKDKPDTEVMGEILKTEKMMQNTYGNIRHALEASDAAMFMAEEDLAFVLDGLRRLETDEARHVSMVLRFVSQVTRIR